MFACFIILVWKSTLLPDFVIKTTAVTTELLYTQNAVPVLVFRCMFNLIYGYKYKIVWYALHLIILCHSLKTRNYVAYMQQCKGQISTHTQSLPYLCNLTSQIQISSMYLTKYLTLVRAPFLMK